MTGESELTRESSANPPRVIIQLGPHESTLSYCDIDTAYFSGNEAPQSQVFGLRLEKPAGDNLQLSPNDPRWVELLSTVTLGADSRHIFEFLPIAKEKTWSALMVRMIPDGGMARFRAYGQPVKPALLKELPGPDAQPINLLSPVVGGQIIEGSDANFSPPTNLLLEGRGIDMSDGWETRRSQHNRGKYAPGQPLYGQERKEWAIGRLGVPGVIKYVEIDAAYHVGNYPAQMSVEACYSEQAHPGKDAKWTMIVRKQPGGPHRQHWLQLDEGETQVWTHVRVNIYPDGGLKRFRVFGFPMEPTAKIAAPATPVVNALPLTYEAFKPFGSVVQGWDSYLSAPKGIPVISANQSTAAKFNRLGSLPEGDLKLKQVRQDSQTDVTNGAVIPLNKLKLVTDVNMAIPQGLGAAPGEKPLKAGGAYVVAVAQSGADGKADLSTLRAFLATPAQGIVCQKGTWCSDLIVVNNTLDFATLGETGEAQEGHFADIAVPPYKPKLIQAPVPTAAPSATSRLGQVFGSSVLQPAPITGKAFAPYGEIIANSANDAMTITNSYPKETGAKTSIGVYRATRKEGLERGKMFDVYLMERHPYTSQAFIPMGKASWDGKGEDALGRAGAFLLVVAENGPDDRPDPSTLKAFIAEAGTGINYKAGVWHHPALVLDGTLDLACIEAQIALGTNDDLPDKRDCELLTYEEPIGRIAVPEL